jgi:hypothetical protein
MSDNTDKRTATQKIEDLEKVVTMLCQTVFQLQNTNKALTQLQSDVGLLKHSTKLLDRKLDGVITSASSESGITLDSVKAFMIDASIKELKDQVANHLKNGELLPANEITANGFCVCEEYGTDGAVTDPRVQFRLDSQKKETVDALLGKKPGDLVTFGDNTFSVKILEVYALPPTPSPDAAPTDAAVSSETAPAASDASLDAPQTAAQTGPSNDNFTSAPTETPIETFVSDAGSVTPAATG